MSEGVCSSIIKAYLEQQWHIEGGGGEVNWREGEVGGCVGG